MSERGQVGRAGQERDEREGGWSTSFSLSPRTARESGTAPRTARPMVQMLWVWRKKRGIPGQVHMRPVRQRYDLPAGWVGGRRAGRRAGRGRAGKAGRETLHARPKKRDSAPPSLSHSSSQLTSAWTRPPAATRPACRRWRRIGGPGRPAGRRRRGRWWRPSHEGEKKAVVACGKERGGLGTTGAAPLRAVRSGRPEVAERAGRGTMGVWRERERVRRTGGGEGGDSSRQFKV